MATIYLSKSHQLSFVSNAPLEKISASLQVLPQLVIHVPKNELIMSIVIKGFNFANALMQEHFNENYMESDKYPTSIFRGKFVETLDFNSPNPQAATVKGTIELHGISKEVIIAGTISKSGDYLKIEGKHLLKMSDFKIQIPEALGQKIAETVEVSFSFELKPKV